MPRRSKPPVPIDEQFDQELRQSFAVREAYDALGDPAEFTDERCAEVALQIARKYYDQGQPERYLSFVRAALGSKLIPKEAREQTLAILEKWEGLLVQAVWQASFLTGVAAGHHGYYASILPRGSRASQVN